MEYINVNAHIHTPYSFSAFSNITDALDRAVAENVKVVGINDFYSTDGYTEWECEACKRHLYPLFNIEFISLQSDDQAAGIRVNDPNNPGRTYISGKGLKCPPLLPEPFASELAAVRSESNAQTRKMCDKMNVVLRAHGAGFELDYDLIERDLTKGLVRERHLAAALRQAVYAYFVNDVEAVARFFEKLFDGKPLRSGISNHAAIENEIRSNLLKAGGAAFVAEDPKAFLPLENVNRIILAAGGIPTYPFLGDNPDGAFTDFESDVARAAKILKQRRIFSAEFITSRNSIEALESYAGYLADNGFVVTFGSEHNMPAMEPVELFARGGLPLTPYLKRINYEGACIVAAHQELVNKGKTGYVDANGIADMANRDACIKLGDEVIRRRINAI